MNLVTTGSRDWPEDEREAARVLLDRLLWKNGEIHHCHVGYDPERQYPRGIDRIVYEELAWVLDTPSVPIRLHTFPADWDRYGKQAGVIRNAEMLKAAGSGLVVAFHASRGHFLNEHTGTNRCARLAERLGFEVYDLVRNPR